MEFSSFLGGLKEKDMGLKLGKKLGPTCLLKWKDISAGPVLYQAELKFRSWVQNSARNLSSDVMEPHKQAHGESPVRDTFPSKDFISTTKFTLPTLDF